VLKIRTARIAPACARRTMHIPIFQSCVLWVSFLLVVYLACAVEHVRSETHVGPQAGISVGSGTGTAGSTLKSESDAMYTQAQNHLRAGLIARAVTELDRLLSIDPTHLGALRLRITCRKRLGDCEGAADDLIRVQSLLGDANQDTMQLRAMEILQLRACGDALRRLKVLFHSTYNHLRASRKYVLSAKTGKLGMVKPDGAKPEFRVAGFPSRDEIMAGQLAAAVVLSVLPDEPYALRFMARAKLVSDWCLGMPVTETNSSRCVPTRPHRVGSSYYRAPEGVPVSVLDLERMPWETQLSGLAATIGEIVSEPKFPLSTRLDAAEISTEMLIHLGEWKSAAVRARKGLALDPENVVLRVLAKLAQASSKIETEVENLREQAENQTREAWEIVGRCEYYKAVIQVARLRMQAADGYRTLLDRSHDRAYDLRARLETSVCKMQIKALESLQEAMRSEATSNDASCVSHHHRATAQTKTEEEKEPPTSDDWDDVASFQLLSLRTLDTCERVADRMTLQASKEIVQTWERSRERRLNARSQLPDLATQHHRPSEDTSDSALGRVSQEHESLQTRLDDMARKAWQDFGSAALAAEEYALAAEIYFALLRHWPITDYRDQFIKASQLTKQHSHIKSSYYAVLGVNRSASASTIRRAYYRLAKEFHPDRVASTMKNDSSKEDLSARRRQAEVMFLRIAKAYEVLSDPVKRRIYDSGEFSNDDLQ